MAEVAKAAKSVANSSGKDDGAGGAGGAGLMKFSDTGLCPDLSVSQVRHQTIGRAGMGLSFRARLQCAAQTHWRSR